ncbi:AMP-binding protein [Ferrovibrio terrae]|uniref:AMP-binding protein n=1 Tax=Ferrovibrio terrae TaxID=2594003 RepID=UPI0031377566
MEGRLSHLLIDASSPAPTIAICRGQRKSQAQFRADVAVNAGRLRQHGCRRGLLLTEDSYWAAVGLFALLDAGCEIVFPPNGRPGTLEAMAGSFDCLVSDEPLPHIPSLVLQDGGPLDKPSDRPLDPASPIAFFTSGSTGTGKRVDKCLRQLEQEAAAIEATFGTAVPVAACVHATVSHQHVYGLAFRLCWPLATGRVFEGRTHDIWESVMAVLHDRSVLVTSPAHLMRLEGIAPLPASRRPSLLLSAGAPLAAEAAIRTAQLFGVPVTEIFGSTETGAIAWRNHHGPDADWQPLPGVKIGANTDGCMVVQAPYVDSRQTSADLVELLPGGGFHFLGRSDRVVKIEGKRVDLKLVEQTLRSLPWISDAAVILHEPTRRVAAAVTMTVEGRDQLAQLGAFRFGRLLQKQLSATQEPVGLPRRWRFVAGLPIAALGKRRQADIAALFDAAQPETAS